MVPVFDSRFFTSSIQKVVCIKGQVVGDYIDSFLCTCSVLGSNTVTFFIYKKSHAEETMTCLLCSSLLYSYYGHHNYCSNYKLKEEKISLTQLWTTGFLLYVVAVVRWNPEYRIFPGSPLYNMFCIALVLLLQGLFHSSGYTFEGMLLSRLMGSKFLILTYFIDHLNPI